MLSPGNDHSSSQKQNPLRHRWREMRRAPLRLLLAIVIWSSCLGWGLAQTQLPSARQFAQPVDPVPEEYQLGQQVYVQNCGSCHVALPPQVLPTQTWEELLLSSQHYGQQIELPSIFERRIMWDYLQVFSRPYEEEEQPDYRLARSRFFQALHPNVEFEQPIRVGSCMSCHAITTAAE
jgi:hypothetical protein